MRRSLRLGALLLAAAAAVPAVATPTARTIKYTIAGDFSGTLGTESFTNAAMTFTGVGNTGTFYALDVQTTVPVTLRISSTAFAHPVHVTDSEAFGVIPGSGAVFFSNIDPYGDPLSNYAAFVASDSLVGYSGLTTQVATGSDLLYASSASTTGGAFNVVSGANITFSATVPEPAAWTLMIAGFGLVGAARRLRRPDAVAA